MLEQYQVNDYKFANYVNINDNLLYLDHINNTYEFTQKSISPDLGYRYRGNLFGLFREINIDTKLFVFTMYINGYTHPANYDGEKLVFKVAIKPPVPSS